jgi:hypothetical protein
MPQHPYKHTSPHRDPATSSTGQEAEYLVSPSERTFLTDHETSVLFALHSKIDRHWPLDEQQQALLAELEHRAELDVELERICNEWA